MIWLAKNIGTIAIALLLIALVSLILRKLITDKKKGKSSCGCNCAHCAMSGQCHKES